MKAGGCIRSELTGLKKTVHGGQAWKTCSVEDYSQNLNPFGPPKDIGDIILKASDDVCHYPDDGSSGLKNAISEKFFVDSDCIIIGAGSSDIIRMFPNTFIEKGSRVIVQSPSFAEYSHQCRIAGAEVFFNKLAGSFRIDFEKLKNKADGAKAVYLCNPNNPTGVIEKRDDILDFTEYCEDRGVLVFVDETLLELVPDFASLSCSKEASKHSNMLVVQSLTKSFAIPGIRIGYGFGNPDLIGEMEKVRMTWNTGCIEQAVGETLIREKADHVRKAADMLRKEADWMYDELKKIGFPAVRTDSFFFFNSVEPLGMRGSEFVKRMLKENIMVRDCASFGKEYEGFVRFCVKDRERDEKFISAISKVM